MSIIDQLLEQTRHRLPPANWQATGLGRSDYLDVAERIVREAVNWLQDGDKIIDPVEHEEWGQSTSRFVSSAAVLIAEGRCTDLQNDILAAMDRCCHRLAAGDAASPDFWLRELMTAYNALQPLFPERAQAWARDIRAIVPETVYWQVENDDFAIEDLRNWTVYAAAGEAMREAAGLAPDQKDIVWGYGFFDKYLPIQRKHFSEHGMYRDPGDPLTYDLTTRLQFALALEAGAGGAYKSEFDDLLKKGGLLTLLLTSPDGLVPFGGRSSQYNFQEIIVSALCEIEANRWGDQDPQLAGAFKRQAHLSLQAVKPWLLAEPMRSLKNYFLPEDRHGFDSYGKYAVYSLLAASFCVLAAQRADDSIQEHPCLAEIGGYVLSLQPAFHKVIANSGCSQVVVELAGDPHYDATGLGRFVSTGIPLPLVLGMPLCGDPAYDLPEGLNPDGPSAIGPEWQRDGEWIRLSGRDLNDAKIEVLEQSDDGVSFEVTYPGACSETYTLSDRKLIYGFETAEEEPRLRVPLLVNDGQTTTNIALSEDTATVSLGDRRAVYRFAAGVNLELTDDPQANRNGVYRVLLVTGSDGVIIEVE